MRTALLICLLAAIPFMLLTSCESSTEPEKPQFRNGSNAKLAIEMPPVFSPPPRVANVTTEWWVLQAGQLWFNNIEKDPISLTLRVREVRTGIQQQVGKYALNGFENRPMTLEKEFTTNAYRGVAWSWYLIFEQRNLSKTITVGVAE